MSYETDDAQAELIPPTAMQAEDWAHVARVQEAHAALVRSKYSAGKLEHGGQCWRKPGMLAHALDESADLSVYLFTLAEQMQALVLRIRAGNIGPEATADEIERWLTK